MTTYTVRAKRWEHGWELHIDGIGVTQSRTLDTAEGMVRDYVASLTGRDTAADAVEIRPDLGGLEADAAAARERVERSQREGREAIAAFGKVAQRLRGAGLSLTDTATLLGVSRGRISQLGGTGRLSSSLRLPALFPGGQLRRGGRQLRNPLLSAAGARGDVLVGHVIAAHAHLGYGVLGFRPGR